MSLNIKNPEAHRLAQELARLRGISLTAAVTEAVREKSWREKRLPRRVATAERASPNGS